MLSIDLINLYVIVHINAPLTKGRIMPMVGDDFRYWSDLLAPERYDVWQRRTGDEPSTWPEAMQDGVRSLMSGRPYSGDEYIQAMAEWMYHHPNDI